jgi:hypothetical protein
MRFFYFLILIAAVFIGCSDKSTEKHPETSIEFEYLEHDYGEIPVGVKSYCTFIYKNTGDNPLYLENVKPSCGCTAPKWDKEPIDPGESGEIEIAIKPSGPGNFSKSIDVYSNTDDVVTKLIIKGYGIGD